MKRILFASILILSVFLGHTQTYFGASLPSVNVQKITVPAPPVESKSLKFSFTTQDAVPIVTFSMADATEGGNNFTFTIDWGDTTAPQTLTTEGGVLICTREYEHPAAYTISVQKTSTEGFKITVDMLGQSITDFTADGDNCTALQNLALNGCTLLASVDVSGCTALQTLRLNGCTSLTSAALTGLTSLQNLPLIGCTLNESALTMVISQLIDRTGLDAGNACLVPQAEGYPQTLTTEQQAAFDAKNWICD